MRIPPSRKPFEVQEKFRQQSDGLEIANVFSVPKENARFKSIFPAEIIFRIVKYSTNSVFWNVANHFRFLKDSKEIPKRTTSSLGQSVFLCS